MDMSFSVGGSLSFGFDVGGSTVPPSGADVGVCTGTMALVYAGGIADFDSVAVCSGTMTVEV